MIVEYVSKEFWIYHPQNQSGRREDGKYNHRQGKTDLSFGGNALNVVMLFFPKPNVTEKSSMRSAVDAVRI